MSELERWQGRYAGGDTPWELDRPSPRLQTVLADIDLKPCRAADLGCGTGASAVWLAQQGFEVTGIDLSPLAVERARQRAEQAGVSCRFLAADLTVVPPELGGPFDFLFDRGCYHVIRRIDVRPYLATLAAITRPGTVGLFLTGNACEPRSPGPPVVSEEEIRAELGSVFEVLRLEEFRFEPSLRDPDRPLGWSCLVRRG
jgi:SAM-dependent methyltransferase